MQRYAIVVRDDEISREIETKVKAGLKDHLIYDEDNPQLVIGIGGDGTMLQCVHRYMDNDCYFVGIHTGTLGFFTDYRKNEVDNLINDILSAKYQVNERHLLEVTVKYQDHQEVFYALNEMRIDHDFSTQVIDVYINDDLLEVFRGNGVCVSTPSGSTAYNKSLGGAVIYPGVPLMQLTEVAGIHHNAYRSLGSSLILDNQQTIKLIGKHFKDVFLGIDHLSYHLKDVEYLQVRLSNKVVRFIEYKEMSFIKRVRRAYIN